MNQFNLKKIIFMLFDKRLLDDVIRIYEKNTYVDKDIDTNIAYYVSKVYTSENSKDVMEYLSKIKEMPGSDIFPDIKSLIISLAINAYDANILEYSSLLSLFKLDEIEYVKNNNIVIYNTPAFYRITVNGKDFDSQLDLITKCQTYLGDKIIFRNNIEKLSKTSYKNYLKVRHSLETKDYEYGLEAVKNLQELFYIEKLDKKVTQENYKELLSDYIIILDFMSAFQILQYKFTNTVEYFRLKEMFKNLILELSVDSLLIMEKSKENVLKMIAETKKRLVEDVHVDLNEINEYLKPIIQRIKDNFN